MISLKKVVEKLDSVFIANSGIATPKAFGLAETIKDGDGTVPYNGETNFVHSDIYPCSWYHRSKGCSVSVSTREGEGRAVYSDEKWDMVCLVYADRNKLANIDPDELYRRFASAFPIFEGQPFDGREIVAGTATVKRVSFERYAILAAEFGQQETNFGPNMLIIQIDYTIGLTLRPGCQTFPCIGPGCG